jgi:hypothetical protein
MTFESTLSFDEFFDSETRDWFSDGGCHELAVSLHRLYDWPLYVVTPGSQEDWVHALVKVPDEELYVDIEGMWTLEEIHQKYPRMKLVSCSQELFGEVSTYSEIAEEVYQAVQSL